MFGQFGGIALVRSNMIAPDAPIVEIDKPKTVEIPTLQHVGKNANVCVAVGDKVKRGSLIAKAVGKTSSNIFSSVSGKVVKIYDKENNKGIVCKHIVIQNDYMNDSIFFDPIKNNDHQAIVERIHTAGIVGMGGAGYPTYAKILPSLGGRVHTLVVNACECDPYVFCDQAVLYSKASEVLEGSAIVADLLGAKNIIFGIQKGHKLAKLALENAISSLKDKKFNITVTAVPSRYPAGSEIHLIYLLTGRMISAGDLPTNVGYMCNNVQTMLAVFEAVRLGKPLYERVLSVVGGCVEKPTNYLIPNGTSYEHIYDIVKKPKAQVVKVVDGGAMTGVCQIDFDSSVSSTSSAVLFLDKKEASLDGESTCINCGKCTDVCPMKLMPMKLDKAVLSDDVNKIEKYGLGSCILCGCCSYICPARRNMVQRFTSRKREADE